MSRWQDYRKRRKEVKRVKNLLNEEERYLF